jgi:hypothetical protein
MNWFWWRKTRGQRLLCMRAAHMFRIHPETDWTHVCGQCGEKVGIYPSGQAVLKKLGEKNVEIICNVCGSGLSWSANLANLAPGAREEVTQSIPNPKLRRN